MPTVKYSLPRKTKKLNGIHREVIRIYTGTFRKLPGESMNVEACDPTMELSRNKLGPRFL